MQLEMTWRLWAEGKLTDAEAQAAAEAVHAFRQAGGGSATGSAQRLQAATARPRRRQRSPDRQRSIERRRRLAASGPLPPALAAAFTVGEQAVMAVAADEAVRHGGCRVCLDAIAARAGVCRTTARNALATARRLGLLVRLERRRQGLPSLTNVVRLGQGSAAKAWRLWLERGPRGRAQKNAHHGYQGTTKLWTTAGPSERPGKQAVRTGQRGPPMRSQGNAQG